MRTVSLLRRIKLKLFFKSTHLGSIKFSALSLLITIISGAPFSVYSHEYILNQKTQKGPAYLVMDGSPFQASDAFLTGSGTFLLQGSVPLVNNSEIKTKYFIHNYFRQALIEQIISSLNLNNKTSLRAFARQFKLPKDMDRISKELVAKRYYDHYIDLKIITEMYTVDSVVVEIKATNQFIKNSNNRYYFLVKAKAHDQYYVDSHTAETLVNSIRNEERIINQNSDVLLENLEERIKIINQNSDILLEHLSDVSLKLAPSVEMRTVANYTSYNYYMFRELSGWNITGKERDRNGQLLDATAPKCSYIF